MADQPKRKKKGGMDFGPLIILDPDHPDYKVTKNHRLLK